MWGHVYGTWGLAVVLISSNFHHPRPCSKPESFQGTKWRRPAVRIANKLKSHKARSLEALVIFS